MRRAAPWIAVSLGCALLVADLVLMVLLRREVVGLKAVPAVDRGTLERIEALETAGRGIASRLARLEAAAATRGASDEGPAVPPGRVVADFDEGDSGWERPSWSGASVMHARAPEMVRRGTGSLAIGYVYGERAAAASGPVDYEGKLSRVSACVRTRARPVTVAVGVLEESGALYEVRLPELRPGDGWRLVTVDVPAMGPAPGSRDGDGRLDPGAVKGVYVADRSDAAGGGNVLLLDDVAVETVD